MVDMGFLRDVEKIIALCPQKKQFEACDCSTCKRILERNHPDVRWGPDPSVRSIKIEDVREVMNWVWLKPYEAARKVVIVQGADRLTLEAANAFLKTLEEPPGHTIFCLLCESKAQLLETIQSRSFEIRLRPLDGDQEEEKYDFREMFLSLSTGLGAWEQSLEKCQTLSREELKKYFDAFMEYLRGRIENEAKTLPGEQASIPEWLEALDIVYECKDALSANANQKLILSRLTMHLGKIFAPTFILPHVVGEERRGR
jgi:DNA polymerase III delta prime subunit